MTRIHAEHPAGVLWGVMIAGEEVPFCIEADDVEGWARCDDYNPRPRTRWSDMTLHEDGQEHIRYGRVTLIPPTVEEYEQLIADRNAEIAALLDQMYPNRKERA